MGKQGRPKQTANRDQGDRTPTTEKLAKALEEAGAPEEMITHARAGYYDDYKSDVAAPIAYLVQDARTAGLTTIAERAIDGDFDAQGWEADEWAHSPDGQATFAGFFKGKKRP
jgi:hypothetical protein